MIEVQAFDYNNQDNSAEQIVWCEENCSAEWHFYGKYSRYGNKASIFGFSTEEDAVYFKMTWT